MLLKLLFVVTVLFAPCALGLPDVITDVFPVGAPPMALNQADPLAFV
jgi:hypothetical protein